VERGYLRLKRRYLVRPLYLHQYSTCLMLESRNLPQIRLPSSNIPIPMRKTGLRSKFLYAFPHEAWNAAMVKKKADAYL
jgi:hypothetical protein